MRASLKVLLDYQRRKEEEYNSKVEMPCTLRGASSPEQMNVMLEMDPAVADNHSFKDNGTTITVLYEHHEYLLEKDGLACDCEFSQTMKLPCRHAMVYRKANGYPLIIPFSSIASRYFQVVWTEPSFTGKLVEKYRRTQQAFGRISGELVQFPDSDFNTAMAQLEQWWYNLRRGRVVDTQDGDGAENDGDQNEDGSGGNAETPDETTGSSHAETQATQGSHSDTKPTQLTTSASNEPLCQNAAQ
ncbi:hypothetical protein F441_04205 [Phytophthora nicotianae CJ01A1]|uniref:SWIM-type domain-containing protein n=3 Tax=Phytophthora nicotianae TaxID=4792 RepID=W2XIN5_PHYNI|nr:hypothetical protein F441_04205 [Phytophthora nicotianae CJ01A1]